MKRTDLIEVLARRSQTLSQQDVSLCVQVILDAIRDALAAGRHIELRGFGCFDLRWRESRNGRNPKTGESVRVPAKPVIRFKPGKELREKVRAGLE
jgi:integration host factor subunit beta